jgi:tRNA(Ile)-lysidine synthase
MARCTAILTRVIAALDRLGVRQGRLLVAVSGGADSMALLHLLQACAAGRGLELVVAHLNHQLRGPASDADQRLVEEYCRQQGLPLCVAMAPVRRLARENQTNLEAQARAVRYRWLAEQAQAAGAPWAATAHQADDQAETVLHHLLRGTHLAGLRGIAPRRRLANNVAAVRPLLAVTPLAVTRREIEAYLAHARLPFCMDQSNLDLAFTRNWLRQVVLKPLKERYGDVVIHRLAALAAGARRMHRRLARRAARWLARAELPRAGPMIVLDAKTLARASTRTLAALFVALWRREHWPRGEMTRRHWQRLAHLARQQNAPMQNARMDLPGGVRAARKGNVLQVSCKLRAQSGE